MNDEVLVGQHVHLSINFTVSNPHVGLIIPVDSDGESGRSRGIIAYHKVLFALCCQKLYNVAGIIFPVTDTYATAKGIWRTRSSSGEDGSARISGV